MPTNDQIKAMIEWLKDLGDTASFVPSAHHKAAAMLRELLAELEWRDMDSAPRDNSALFFGRGEEIIGPCHIDDINQNEWDFWFPCSLPPLPTPEAGE